MQPDLPPPHALSLQEKLDRIAHERDVLALQRELAQGGLREGDPVVALDGGARGRLLIARDHFPPRLRVVADDGTSCDFSSGDRRRA
jgi:hypothetical protein